MSSQPLREFERVVERMAGEVAAAQPSPEALWQVTGAPLSGKTTLLRELSRRLEERKLWPVLLRPPPRAPDSGPLVLVQIAGELRARGVLNGELPRVTDPRRPWAEKLLEVRRWLRREEVQERLVLLCDEPLGWALPSGEDGYFSTRSEDVIATVLEPVSCRRVVTGGLPHALRPLHVDSLRIPPAPRGWLADPQRWASLTPVAWRLEEVLGEEAARLSALELRLWVALAALSSVEAIQGLRSSVRGPRALSSRLAERLAQEQTRSPLLALWARLALVRRPFDEQLLQALGAAGLSVLEGDILRCCLLHSEGGQLSLHEVLRAHARSQPSWLAPAERRDAHARLARYYQQRFQSHPPGDAYLGERLLDEMEAFFHGASAGDAATAERFHAFFVEQLDALGRELSLRAREEREPGGFLEAARIFERSLDWNPQDGYAHHYLAYNLDVVGRDARRVEEHFRKALELEPRNVWWRSRTVCFLITRGRLTEAEEEWNAALDVLGLPDESAPAAVYENLHLWVARLLLHRGHLDFAARVLKDIPAEALGAHPGLQAMAQRLEAMLEARRRGAFVPGRYLRAQWWQEAPFLLSAKVASGGRLWEWMVARVDEVVDGALLLRVARSWPGHEAEPEYGTLELSFEQFDRMTLDAERAEQLAAGRFLEIGKYGSREEPEVRIRVHPERTWGDELLLPPLFPDPTRYLRQGFARVEHE